MSFEPIEIGESTRNESKDKGFDKGATTCKRVPYAPRVANGTLGKSDGIKEQLGTSY